MKRTVLSLMTLAALCAVSCESKKEISETALSEPMPGTEENGEPAFREYSSEDFREIRVNFDYQEGEPPVSIKEYDLSLKLTPKMSPCKADAVVEEDGNVWLHSVVEVGSGYVETNDNGRHFENAEEVAENRRKVISTPTAYYDPEVSAFGGGHFYYIVNHDDICMFSHCFEVMALDIESGESETVWEYSGERSVMIKNMTYIDGKVYLQIYFHDSKDEKDNGIYVIGGGRAKKLDMPEFEGRYSAIINEHFTDRLVIESDKMTINDSTHAVEKCDHLLMEYHPGDGSWEEIAHYESDGMDDRNVMGCGGNIVSVDKDDSGRVSCTVEGRYTLNTGLRGAELQYADEGRAAFTIADKVGNRLLYVYDIEKGERYDYDLTGEATVNTGISAVGGDWLYIMRDKMEDMLLLPSIGAAYSTERLNMRFCADDRVVTAAILDENGEAQKYLYRKEYMQDWTYVFDEEAAKERTQRVRITTLF